MPNLVKGEAQGGGRGDCTCMRRQQLRQNAWTRVAKENTLSRSWKSGDVLRKLQRSTYGE